MGITIHYAGRLRKPEDVEGLIAELVDIAETLGWPHEVIREDLTGLSFDPHPDCESFVLLFDREGRIRNPVLESEGFGCKTRFAPVQVHVALVKLLRHLQKRWFAELTVEDESGYWKSGDLRDLERRFARKVRADRPPHPEDGEEDLETRIDRILAEHEGKPIKLTEDEHRRVLGPGGPLPEETAGWDVERWIESFSRHDEGKNPLLHAMRGRPETEKDLREAFRIAEEEERKDEAAMLKYMARVKRELKEGKEEDDEEESGLSFGEPAGEEASWTASLPEYEAEDEVDLKEERTDAAYKLAIRFSKELSQRLRGRKRIHPAIHYVMALKTMTLVGLHMGGWWARQARSPLPRIARRRLGAERFRTIARVFRAFPKLNLEALAPAAEKISRLLEKEA